MQIPPFNARGNLPPGIHHTDWEAFKERFGTTLKRKKQLKGLQQAIYVFRRAGGKILYIDGSFVSSKLYPKDYDVCYVTNELNPNIIDYCLLNTSQQGRLKQKAIYKGEFFPVYMSAGKAAPNILGLFQMDKRTREPKGIVALHIEDIV